MGQPGCATGIAWQRVISRVKDGSTPLVIPVRLCQATLPFWGATIPDIADAISQDRNGLLIAIEVTSGAKTKAFPAGYNVWRKTIGCRVMVPALGGKANRAVVALIAEVLEVPDSSVTIRSGATSSQKKITVTGISKTELLRRLMQKAEREGAP